MRVLVVYAHPSAESFAAALRDTAIAALDGAGHEVRLADLYAEGFDPVMSAGERRSYHDEGRNEEPVAGELARLRWAEALVFVYPTWWYGLPAILKGWLDRVLVPHATFALPEPGKPIRPRLTNIRRLVVLSSCGAPWWWMMLVGAPGRRTLTRGVRAICHPACRTRWLAHYRMDSSTDRSRRAFLARVERRLARL